MKKNRKWPEAGEVVAIPLKYDSWVYLLQFPFYSQLFNFRSTGLIRDEALFKKKEWFAFIQLHCLNTSCLTVGKVPLAIEDRRQFFVAEHASLYPRLPCEIFDGEKFRQASREEAANLEKFHEFKTVSDFRHWVSEFFDSLPCLTGTPTPIPAPPKPMDVTFEFRNLLSTENMDPERKAENLGYKERLANTPWGAHGVKMETEDLAKGMEFAIKRWEYHARIKQVDCIEGFVLAECSAADANHFLSTMRNQIAMDARDHRRFRFVEIEQRGPGPNEVKIFGTKGPAKFESGVEPLKEKTAVFDADGRDADTFSPFTLEDQRMEKDSPEVRLEFEDFDGLDETLDLEDGLELDGNTLGDIMMAVIDKKKLVKDKEGTHPGGYFDNCEGETVLFHFNSLRDAVAVAGHFQKIFTDKRKLRTLLKTHIQLSQTG